MSALRAVERRLSLGLVALMTLQPALGLLAPGTYRDVPWVAATWWGNDLITLVLAAPGLAVATALTARGSHRARLVWLGLMGYGVYNFAFYLLGAALNAFFLIYVLAFVTSGASLIAALPASGHETWPTRFSPRTPVRLLGGYFVFVAAGLLAVWVGTWAAYIFAGRPTPVAPEFFRLVAALDSALMVPALATGGVLLWRRRPWGFVVASLAGVQASLYLLVLTLNSAVAVARGLAPSPGELPVWGTLLLPTAAATVWLIGSCGAPTLDDAAEPRRRG